MKLTITEVSNEEFQQIITEGDPVESAREAQLAEYSNALATLGIERDVLGYIKGLAMSYNMALESVEVQLELWRKSEEGTLAQMAETNERFEGALWKIEELEAQLASATARIEAIGNALDDASAPDATEAHALDNDPIIERIKLWKYAQDELGDQLASANEKREWCKANCDDVIARNDGLLAAAELRAADLGRQLAESKRLWEVADQDRVASRKIAKDASRRAADLAKALEEIAEGRFYCGDGDCRAIETAQAALNPDTRQEGDKE